jgi:hypothetical protein
VTRRDFVKTAAAATAISRLEAAGDAMPSCESLTSVDMPHRFGDLFNPPAVTNFLGCAQAAVDLTAIRSVAFPPFAQGEISVDVLGSRGDLNGVLFVDGVYFTATREPITFVWRPDRIERRASLRGIRFSSTTIVPPGQNGAAFKLRIENGGGERREIEIALKIQGGVTKKTQAWGSVSPGESDNRITVEEEKCAVVFEARHSKAAAAQAVSPKPSAVSRSGFVYNLELAPGESKEIAFSNVLGADGETVLAAAIELAQNFESAAASAQIEWDNTLRAAFTRGNGRFSGCLPSLITSDPALLRLYHTALVTLLFHRRSTPASIYGTTYVTLAPRYWETTTFLWDISLSSTMLALLDPTVLKRMLETWMTLDIHKHFGTDLLTGEGVGPWYSVNDFAMCRMARDYLRWSGEVAWLDKKVGGVTVMDRLFNYATHWRALNVNGHGLADYGGVNNLLEAVSSYVHEVAGLNAANVFCMRFVADLLERRGDTRRSSALRQEASALARRVLDLYVLGGGYWNCRLPDGRLQPVRHCYDFGTVLSTIPQDLSEVHKREMVAFFQRELQTPAWMRALSTHDADVLFSVRPDHQWTGAYAAWPALALNAIYKAGEPLIANRWLKGLARTAMQGPIAQANFAETAVDAEAGGAARKSPSDVPWINDWACVAGSAFAEPILEGLFGIQADMYEPLRASPHLAGLEAPAELRGLRYQGKMYRVSGSGVALSTDS